MQNLKVAFFLAYKSITRGGKLSTALIIFILSITFVNLIFITAIGDGVVFAINRQIAVNGVSNIVLEPQEEPVRKNYIIHAEELERSIEQIGGVVAAARRYKLAATLSYDKNKDGKFKYAATEVIAVEPERERKMSEVAQKIISGRYLEGLGSGEIILGADLAGESGNLTLTSLEGAKVGEKLRVTFNNNITRIYTIKGVFQVKFGPVDRAAFITTREAESLLSVYDNASQILVKTEDFGGEDNIIAQIEKLAPDLKVRKWNDYVGDAGGLIESFKQVQFIVNVVGSVVVAASLFIIVYIDAARKRRQIGILRAIGIRHTIIVYSYLLQSLFYAIAAMGLGLLFIFYVLEPYIAAHPLPTTTGAVRMAISQIGLIHSILILLGAAFIGGIIPAWKAARENIIDAIWGA